MKSILDKFKKITLEEMKSIRLMNRCDTKFSFSSDLLPALLEQLKDYYRVVEIDGKRLFEYETLYYDTPDNLFYKQHHNKNLNRYKIRFRKYKDAALCFFEIKFKSNKGKTKKKRIRTHEIETLLDRDLKNYIKKKMGENNKIDIDTLEPKLWSVFNRITLASIKHKERITIDLNLSFNTHKDKLKKVNKLVVVEVKQDRFTLSTPFMNIIRELKIQPSSFSKYCIGMTVSNIGSIKHNMFKEKLLNIKKINAEKIEKIMYKVKETRKNSSTVEILFKTILSEAA